MITRLDQLLANRSLETPGRIAVIDSSSSITYKDLDGSVSAVCGCLKEKGLEKGARVGLISRNSIKYVTVYFAISRAGGVAVPLNHTLSDADIVRIADDCGLSAIYTGEKMEEKGRRIASEVKSIRFVIDDKSAASQGPGVPAAVKEDDLCSIIYTSGTAEGPLGVMLSHKNIVSNNISVANYLKITDSDSIVCVLPFYYIFGLSVLFSFLLAGGTIIISNSFMYPNTVLDTIDKYKASAFAGVSSHYAILLSNSGLLNRKLPSLKYFMQAGDRMPAGITNRISAAFPDKKIYIMYGQTEASPRLTYLDPSLVKEKPGSVGRPVPGLEIKIVKEDGSECEVGEEGEITARGDNIMMGYWNNAEATARVLRGRWLYTGDLAYKDKDGDVFITGRKKNFIKVGANRINPLEIEKIATEDGRIMEAAAIGLPDPVFGEKILLFVSPFPGAKIEAGQIAKSLRGRLPSYKVPSAIKIVEALPRSDVGKVDKERLVNIP